MFGGKKTETFQAAGRRAGQRGSKFQGWHSSLLGMEKWAGWTGKAIWGPGLERVETGEVRFPWVISASMQSRGGVGLVLELELDWEFGGY